LSFSWAPGRRFDQRNMPPPPAWWPRRISTRPAFLPPMLLLMTHQVARGAAGRRMKILAPGAVRRHQNALDPMDLNHHHYHLS
jgi:hypothetical protein